MKHITKRIPCTIETHRESGRYCALSCKFRHRAYNEDFCSLFTDELTIVSSLETVIQNPRCNWYVARCVECLQVFHEEEE